MLDFPRWKIWGIVLLCLAGIAFAVPSFFPDFQVARWPSFAPRTQINLGLDLRGGSQLLLEADLNDIRRQQLERMEETVRTELRRDPRIQIGEVSTAGGRVSFLLRDPAQVDAARERLLPFMRGAGLSGQNEFDLQVVDQNRIVLTPTSAGQALAVEQALDTATDVIRRRIDPDGTREATVIREGDDRILVQVPGLKDPEGLKRLLDRTARLEFKLVDLAANPEEVQAGRAPPGSQVLPYGEVGGGRIAVIRRAIVSGDQLIDAQQSYDQDGRPNITIRFNNTGGRRFAEATAANVNKPFAIIIDDQVISAPNIEEPILGGTAQINGGYTVQSANELAISLRSGRLPTRLTVIEEQTVGPELGADSIRLGAIASVAAILAVMAFMLVTYGRFGVYANIALIVNALMILGIMAIFNATLTLPGIAGFVLTIGAAVDANVLINERIREERRRGRKVLDAVETGYKEAQTAIFDANITNVIAAALMYYFGSGPIRGFAVVLTIGIITSVFTAVNVTRMLVALYVRKKRPKELYI